MSVSECVLCGKIRKCSPKEIERQEYDICLLCWKALELKLQGKGRVRRGREVVLLPPVQPPGTEIRSTHER
jgi:hypothetical protein